MKGHWNFVAAGALAVATGLANAQDVDVDAELSTSAREGTVDTSTDTREPGPDGTPGQPDTAPVLMDEETTVKSRAGRTVQSPDDADQDAALSGTRRSFGATLETDRNELRVRNVDPGSAAEAFGLRAGDRIIGLDGRTYEDAQSFENAVRTGDRNRTAELLYERNGQLLTRRVQLTGWMSDHPNAQPLADNASVASNAGEIQAAGFQQPIPGPAPTIVQSRQPVHVDRPLHSYRAGRVVYQQIPRNGQIVYRQPVRYHRGFIYPAPVPPHCRPRYVWDYEDQEWERMDDDDWEDYYKELRDRWEDRFDD